MDNATTFGAQAETYASSRPGYPEELFKWISQNAPARDLVWDVGTGSGQAARSLADYFKRVHATDLDASQIEAASLHPNIDYIQSPAHLSGLPDNSADAIAVATALHWFDFDRFWPEVERTALQGALFCGWTYHRIQTDDEVREILIEPVLKVLEPYWSDGNRLSWRGYDPAETGMPFETIETPEFSCELDWTISQLSGMVESWSAHLKARQDGHSDALTQIKQKALDQLGPERRSFSLPLNTGAGRVAKP